MKHGRCLFLLPYLLLWGQGSLAQTGSTNATITFVNPATTCSFSGPSNLSLGEFDVPGTGTLSVTVAALTAALTTSPPGHHVSGASVGRVTLSGANVNTYSVTQNPFPLPTRLTSESDSDDTIMFSALKAKSSDGTTWTGTSSFSSQQFDRGAGGGLFSSFRVYLRLGGTVSGITLATPPATYSETITLTLSCS